MSIKKQDKLLEAEEIHCVGCGRFLGYGKIMKGFVQLYCGRWKKGKKCDTWTIISTGQLQKNKK